MSERKSPRILKHPEWAGEYAHRRAHRPIKAAWGDSKIKAYEAELTRALRKQLRAPAKPTGASVPLSEALAKAKAANPVRRSKSYTRKEASFFAPKTPQQKARVVSTAQREAFVQKLRRSRRDAAGERRES